MFDLGRHLGKGHAQLRNQQHGVKAKTIAATALCRELCLHTAHGNQRFGVLGRTHAHQGADHGGAAVFHALHLLQQRTHIVVVAFLVAKLGAVVSGIYARQATKVVHAHASVVGNGGQAGLFGRKTRLGQGVFHKRAVRLGRFTLEQVALADQFHAQRGEHGLQLNELTAVVGGQHNFHDKTAQVLLAPALYAIDSVVFSRCLRPAPGLQMCKWLRSASFVALQSGGWLH